jgi:hypothetical protein
VIEAGQHHGVGIVGVELRGPVELVQNALAFEVEEDAASWSRPEI